MITCCRSLIRAIVLVLCVAGLCAVGCSPDVTSYDELLRTGTLDQTVRKEFSSFFRAVADLEEAAGVTETPPDSMLVLRAAQETDRVVEATGAFPATVTSRLAFDALAIAAGDMAHSSRFNHPGIRAFWETGLIIPLYQSGYRLVTELARSDEAHLQVLRGIQRGVGNRATDRMLVDAMAVLGVTPSAETMAFCDADTLMFKRIHDLIIYARSRQETDPPLWLLSGDWLLALMFEDAAPLFMVIVPHFTDGTAYLAFRNYTMGDVYAAVFDDPVPEDQEKWDTWIARATPVMGTLSIDDEFARRVSASTLTNRDAHYFYDDYLIHTTADTLSRELYLVFNRQHTRHNEFEHTGGDSIVVTFNEEQIVNADGPVTKLNLKRTIGSSLIGGELYPAETLFGSAYLMSIGQHDPAIVQAYREHLRESLGLPSFDVRVETGSP